MINFISEKWGPLFRTWKHYTQISLKMLSFKKIFEYFPIINIFNVIQNNFIPCLNIDILLEIYLMHTHGLY